MLACLLRHEGADSGTRIDTSVPPPALSRLDLRCNFQPDSHDNNDNENSKQREINRSTAKIALHAWIDTSISKEGQTRRLSSTSTMSGNGNNGFSYKSHGTNNQVRPGTTL